MNSSKHISEIVPDMFNADQNLNGILFQWQTFNFQAWGLEITYICMLSIQFISIVNLLISS